MTTKYRYDYAEPTWVCTSPAAATTPCHGTVLKIDHNGSSHGMGCCQRRSHRTALKDQLLERGWTFDTSCGLPLSGGAVPWIDDHLIPTTERTTMNLNQSDLQRRLYDYLWGRGSYRETALRDLTAAGAFEDYQPEARTREIVEAYYVASGTRGIFCEDGRKRFHDTFLSTELTGGDEDILDGMPWASAGNGDFDLMRYQAAPSGYQCSAYAADHDHHGELLVYTLHNATANRWEQTSWTACQITGHRTEVTTKVRDVYGGAQAFLDSPASNRLDMLTRPPAQEAPIMSTTLTEGIAPGTPLPTFFNDQRTTYDAETIRANTSIPDTDQFVSVPALLDAIKEYQGRFDLCDAGVGEFLDEFGLSLISTFETEILNGNGGPVIATIRWTGTDPSDVENISLGSLDDVVRDAIRDLAENDGVNNVEVLGVDCYFGSTTKIT